MNNGRLEEINLPGSQYYFEVENTRIASASADIGEVVGVTEGKTKVLLHDRNLVESDVGIKLPSATLNVVCPTNLTVSIPPHQKWAVIVGEQHEIIAELYDMYVTLLSFSHQPTVFSETVTRYTSAIIRRLRSMSARYSTWRSDRRTAAG